MANVWTLQELWAAMPAEFQNHIKEADGDLPSASFDALRDEWEKYIDERVQDGRIVWLWNDNQAPAAKGYGLICRACAIAEEDGHVLGPAFDGILPY